MKLTNKLPRTLSLVAAILLLLTLVGSFISNAANWINMIRSGVGGTLIVSIITFLLGSVGTVLCIVVLFMGKKNSIAGVLLILGALITVGIRTLAGIASTVSNIAMRHMLGDMFGALVASNVINVIGGLVTAGFYVLLAIECFNPGKFSASKAKVILFIFPILLAVLSIIGSIVLQLPNLNAGIAAFAVTAVSALLGQLISHVPVLLMGISFATPVYEQDPYAGYPAPPYTNV